MKRFLRIAALAMALPGTACTTRPIDSSVTVTTKPLPELRGGRVGKRVSGSSCTHVYLLVFPVGSAWTGRAYAEALAQAPGADTLVAFESRSTYFSIWPFYRRICTEAHGYATKAAELTGER